MQWLQIDHLYSITLDINLEMFSSCIQKCVWLKLWHNVVKASAVLWLQINISVALCLLFLNCHSLCCHFLQWWMVTQHVCASCWMNRTVQTSWTLLTLRDSEWSSFVFFFSHFLCLFKFVQPVMYFLAYSGLQYSSDAGGGGGSRWCRVAAAGEGGQHQCGQ